MIRTPFFAYSVLASSEDQLSVRDFRNFDNSFGDVEHVVDAFAELLGRLGYAWVKVARPGTQRCPLLFDIRYRSWEAGSVDVKEAFRLAFKAGFTRLSPREAARLSNCQNWAPWPTIKAAAEALIAQYRAHP